MVRDEPPEMAFDGPYKGSAFENGGGVGGAGGGLLMIFASLILLRALLAC